MAAAVQVGVVVIRDATVQKRNVGQNTFESQEAFLKTSEDESLKIEVSLPRGHAGYPAGTYFIGGQSYDRDQYGRPMFGKRGLYLVPVPSGK